jgi:hypothetical protein
MNRNRHIKWMVSGLIIQRKLERLPMTLTDDLWSNMADAIQSSGS